MSKSAMQSLIFTMVAVIGAEFLIRKTPVGDVLK